MVITTYYGSGKQIRSAGCLPRWGGRARDLKARAPLPIVLTVLA